jgi:hypothetical protein
LEIKRRPRGRAKGSYTIWYMVEPFHACFPAA